MNSIPAQMQQSKLGEITLKEFNDSLLMMKNGVILYFLLLILEGALRKWLFPGIATPLLVIRDPLALWLVISAWEKGIFPSTVYLKAMVLLGVVGLFTSTLAGHGNIFVAIYGARMLLLHFPLMFVIGQVINRSDIIKLGKLTLCLSVPMAVLIAFQFFSPQSAWVNRGVGGDMDGAGFSGALGYFRPSGTFSFTNGTALFFSLLSCFIFYFWLTPKSINRILLTTATVALLIVIPLSISRSLFFQVMITFLFALIVILREPRYISRLIFTCLAVLVLFSVISQLIVFQTAIQVFMARFDSANQAEGGLDGVLIDRYLGGLLGAVTGATKLPFFGYGLGMGTNVGSMLLTGEVSYLIAEGEWGRIVGEHGFLLGMAVIWIRLGLCLNFVWASLQKLTSGDILPWMLLSFGLLIVPQGQWAQPTSLGFSTLIGGLIIASLR